VCVCVCVCVCVLCVWCRHFQAPGFASLAVLVLQTCLHLHNPLVLAPTSLLQLLPERIFQKLHWWLSAHKTWDGNLQHNRYKRSRLTVRGIHIWGHVLCVGGELVSIGTISSTATTKSDNTCELGSCQRIHKLISGHIESSCHLLFQNCEAEGLFEKQWQVLLRCRHVVAPTHIHQSRF
jgi:hypothetical protein